jgi:hypothetical protein
MVAGDLCAPSWLPAGHTAVAGGGRVVLAHDFGADPAGGAFDSEADLLFEDKSAQGEILFPAVSHDGTRVAYVQGMSLAVLPAGGGTPTYIASRKNFVVPKPGVNPVFTAWSPDDEFIAVLSGKNLGYVDGVIYVFRADGQPVVGNYLLYEVPGLPLRVDRFDWVASLTPR